MIIVTFEQGRTARSPIALARGGRPAVAASVPAFGNRYGNGIGRLDPRPRLRRSMHTWRPREERGQESPSTGARYSTSTITPRIVSPV